MLRRGSSQAVRRLRGRLAYRAKKGKVAQKKLKTQWPSVPSPAQRQTASYEDMMAAKHAMKSG
jgi:hypothetical protein